MNGIKAIETRYKGYRWHGEAPSAPRKKISVRADLTGRRFERLLVIEDLGIMERFYRLWGCICDCGTKKAVRSRELLKGHTRSCGCLQDENRSKYGGLAGKNILPKGIASANALYSGYRKSAKQRGHEWLISKETFYKLTSLPCHYCGQEPSKVGYGNSKHTTNGEYVYNGIDRADNSKGYLDGNAVSCCYICNVAKATMSQLEFFAWIERVYRHCSARFEHGENGEYHG